jgi:hypothetical protein
VRRGRVRHSQGIGGLPRGREMVFWGKELGVGSARSVEAEATSNRPSSSEKSRYVADQGTIGHEIRTAQAAAAVAQLTGWRDGCSCAVDSDCTLIEMAENIDGLNLFNPLERGLCAKLGETERMQWQYSSKRCKSLLPTSGAHIRRAVD